MDRSQIIPLVVRALEEALEKDCLIIFYGSVLGERFSRASDVDVGVFCREPLRGEEYMKVLARLEELPVLREVELLDLWRVKAADFLDRILQEGYFWKSSEELMRLLRRHSEDLKRLEV